MKVFREFFIQATNEKLKKFADIITPLLPCDEWERDKEAEARLLSSEVRDPMYCFRWNGCDFPSATLWLAFKEPEKLYVSNIVPTISGRLLGEQYNEILVLFCNAINKISTLSSDYTLHLEDEEKNSTDYMSEDAASRLKLFSCSANKSNGSFLHPLDMERWLDFIIAVHRENSNLTMSQLERLLVEDYNWPTEGAMELSGQYSFGRVILNAYRDNHNK